MAKSPFPIVHSVFKNIPKYEYTSPLQSVILNSEDNFGEVSHLSTAICSSVENGSRSDFIKEYVNDKGSWVVPYSFVMGREIVILPSTLLLLDPTMFPRDSVETKISGVPIIVYVDYPLYSKPDISSQSPFL